MIRLATVGTSAITESFIGAALKTGRFTLSAVHSRDPLRGSLFAEKYGCKSFTDLESMAKDGEIDAVYIASPNSLHYPMSRLFLENGKHVLCEKPAGISYAEVKELVRLSEERGLVFAEAMMSVHTEAGERLKSALTQIGKITDVRLDFSKVSSKYEDYLKGKKINVLSREMGGGALNDLGIYCVYAAVDLFGEPKCVTAEASLDSGGCDLSGKAVFCYDGFNANLSYSKVSGSDGVSRIVGEKGTVLIGLVSQFTDITLGGRVIAGDIGRERVMMGEASDFADFTEGKKDCAEFTDLMLTVHKTMDTIRNKSLG